MVVTRGSKENKHNWKGSTVSAQREGVVFLPGGTRRGVVVTVALAETTVLKWKPKGEHPQANTSRADNGPAFRYSLVHEPRGACERG
jgi:hypothetical protein